MPEYSLSHQGMNLKAVDADAARALWLQTWRNNLYQYVIKWSYDNSWSMQMWILEYNKKIHFPHQSFHFQYYWKLKMKMLIQGFINIYKLSTLALVIIQYLFINKISSSIRWLLLYTLPSSSYLLFFIIILFNLVPYTVNIYCACWWLMDGWMDCTLNLLVMAKSGRRGFKLRKFASDYKLSLDLLFTTLAQALLSPPSIEWNSDILVSG